MKKIILAAAIVAMSGATVAFAQSTRSGSGAGLSGTPSGVMQAPIGHRQPRASDVPDEKNLANPGDALSKEDALLDKKIKSICRGC